MKAPKNSELNDLSKGAQLVNSRYCENWNLDFLYSFAYHSILVSLLWPIQIDIFMGHFRSFAQRLFQDKKKNQKSWIKARRQCSNLRHSTKQDAQAQLGCSLRKQLLVPNCQRARAWGLDRWGRLLVKAKTWLQTVLVPEESEQLQTILPKLNFRKDSVISQTPLQEMKA